MDQQEFEEDLERCADCGELVAPDTGAAFTFSDGGTLCFECAIRRKGEYDGYEERWTVAPDLTGLDVTEGDALP